MNLKSLYSICFLIISSLSQAHSNCPDKIEGLVFDFEITTGTGVFAKNGNFLFSSRKESYQLKRVSGEVQDSWGTYSFVKKNDNVGHILANDSVAGVSISHEMIFHTPSSGVYSHSNALGSQSGTFTIIRRASAPNETSTEKTPENQEPENQYDIYTGTGTVIRGGYILTCEHVIEDAELIAYDYKGKVYQADALLVDEKIDFAVLRLQPEDPAFHEGVSFQFDDRLRVGEKVFTLGYPKVGTLGTELKHTEGEISSLTGFKNKQTTMQVSIPSAGGNSGGVILTDGGLLSGILISGVDTLDNVTYGLKVVEFKEKLNLLKGFSEPEQNPYQGLSKPDLIDQLRDSVVLIRTAKKKSN